MIPSFLFFSESTPLRPKINYFFVISISMVTSKFLSSTFPLKTLVPYIEDIH